MINQTIIWKTSVLFILLNIRFFSILDGSIFRWGKLVVTMTIIPIIGFVFLFGFWGYLLANLGSFFVLLLTMYTPLWQTSS